MRADITTVLKARIVINGDQPIHVSIYEMEELMQVCGLKDHAREYTNAGDDSRTHFEVDAFFLEALVILAKRRMEALTTPDHKA